MKVKIAKWGNSLAVRLPKRLAEEAGLRENAEVDVTLDRGHLTLTPHVPIPRYSLEDMIAGMRSGTPSETVEWGPDRGSEILPEDEYSRGEITPENIGRKHVARRR